MKRLSCQAGQDEKNWLGETFPKDMLVSHGILLNLHHGSTESVGASWVEERIFLLYY